MSRIQALVLAIAIILFGIAAASAAVPAPILTPAQATPVSASL